jgi:hypothetical protein
MANLHQEALWWYRQEWRYQFRQAKRRLRELFDAKADKPLAYLEMLFKDPKGTMALSPTFRGVAEMIHRKGKPIPIKGVSVIDIVTAREAARMITSRRGQEAAIYYRQLIDKTLYDRKDELRYQSMETALNPLMATCHVFLQQAVQHQVSKRLLALMMSNWRLSLMLRFWYHGNGRKHSVLRAIETIRATGGHPMWFDEKGGVTIVMEDLD